MNILVAANSKYLMLLLVMLHSLIRNNSSGITIYCLYQSLTPEELKKLRKTVTNMGGILKPIYIEPHQFDDMPIFSYYTEEIYYRLLAPVFCPPSLDRILWLDADMIVNGDLRPLYDSDFEDKMFVAAPMLVNEIVNDTRVRMDLPANSEILNSGMLLMNLELMRKNNVGKSILEFISSHIACIKYPDQDAVNALFQDKIVFLKDDKYNCLVNFYPPNQQMGLIETKVIIHYAGEKPWWYRYGYLGGRFYNHLGTCWWSEAVQTGYMGRYLIWKIKSILFGMAYLPCWYLRKIYRKVSG